MASSTSESPTRKDVDHSPKKRTVHIGIFVPAAVQVLDLACVDIIGCMTSAYMEDVSALVPASVRNLAPDVKFYYIGSVKPGQPIDLTADMQTICTHHYTDEAVAAGKLDIVLVPGPAPFTTEWDMDEGRVAKWLSEQGQCETTDVLSICTGILWCGAAGLLKGKTACGPRGLGDMIRKKGFGEKQLIGEKVRWWQDGRFWSSGGVTNGNDLVAAYCRQSKHFPRPLVEIACEMTDVGDRAQEYNKSQSGFIFTMVLNTFKAWLLSWRT